jgi:hypothetical protein
MRLPDLDLPDLDLSDVISCIALLVSGGSAWYARRTWRAADQANKLNEERRHEELKPQLETDVVSLGEGQALELVSHGPQDYDQVRLQLRYGGRKDPVVALLVEGARRLEDEFGPLRQGEPLVVPLMRNHDVGGTMRILVTCSNRTGSWDVLVEHKFPAPPMVY